MTTPSPTVLNVDDNEVSRYTKTRTLRHAGFSVVDAGTGHEALASTEALRPAIVLLDVRLPDVNGIEVCRIIKQRWPRTMVLQTSATFTSAADRTRGLEGGADSYLIEPFDPNELVAAVRALLRLYTAEEEARLLNETLERRIEERTRDLHRANTRLIEQIAQRERAEAALVQSQKMEAVGQLTGSMAHDFNNILAAVTGSAHVARLKNRQEEIGVWLDQILAAAERGKRLTDRLLAFARNDNLVTGPLDIGALLLDMRDWLRQTLGSGVALEVRAEGGALTATTDTNQLELAILNLVINARDAMPEGGRVVIRAEARSVVTQDQELSPGAYIVVSVTDDGAGMPEEVARRAFEPFYTTKPKGRGTGLGLAQVAQVARLSGGGVRLQSTLGAGTTIELWLAAAGNGVLPGIAPPAAHAPSGKGERVLVVDDEPDIRQAMAILLSEHGYRVETAGSGTEAIASADAVRPDAVVLDFAMPGANGVQVAERLRTRYPHLPVLFVSGNIQLDLLEEVVPRAQLLRKPFRPEELYAGVRLCIEAAARMAESD